MRTQSKIHLIVDKQNRANVLVHFCVWIVYILYESSIILYVSPKDFNIIETLFAFVLNGIVFYVNANLILPKPFHKKYKVVLVFELILLLIFYIYISAQLSKYIFPLIKKRTEASSILIFSKMFIAQHIWRGTYFIILSFGFWFARRSIFMERRLRKLEKEELLMLIKEKEFERKIAVNELELIRSSINPHFLHNTLNFFYSNIYPLSKPLATAILILSNLMRYAFDNGGEDGKVELAEELRQIENFIQLNQMRFANGLNIDYSIHGSTRNKKITCFLLMPIVENAFKHGDLFEGEFPLRIFVKVDDDDFRFHVSNKKNFTKRELERTGIGMKTLEGYLELAYGKNYELNIAEDDISYNCELYLKL